MGLENTNTIAIIRQTKLTPSSLPKVGRTRGANTFPLRNQSLALESLKDQLGFLVTIILGGDSLYPQSKQKTPKPIEDRRDAALRPRGCDRMATPLGTLGLSLVIVFYYAMCCCFFFFCYE